MDAPARIWGRTLGDESPRSTAQTWRYRGVVELGGLDVDEPGSGDDDGGAEVVLLPAPRDVSLLFVPDAAGAELPEPALSEDPPMVSQAARPSTAKAPRAILNEVMTGS